MCWEKLKLPTSVLADIATIVAALIALFALFVGKNVVKEVHYLSQQDNKRTAVAYFERAIQEGNENAMETQAKVLNNIPEYAGVEKRAQTILQSEQIRNKLKTGSPSSKARIQNYILYNAGSINELQK